MSADWVKEVSCVTCIRADRLKEIRGLAEKIIVMSDEGVFDCTDKKCLLMYSVVRDSAYEIKSVLERNDTDERQMGEEKK